MSATVSSGVGAVTLTPEQRQLRDEVEKRLQHIRTEFRRTRRGMPEEVRLLGQKAHELHMSLKSAGTEPRHHRQMIENRGHRPTEPEFYNHVHPVEDLLAFIANTAANNDPTDQTLGHDFRFSVYVRRWGHPDEYQLTRTAHGWRVQHLAFDVNTGPDGRVQGRPGTGLYAVFGQDLIDYPSGLPGYLQWLWKRAASDGLSHDAVQEALDRLGEWVSVVERNAPAGLFEGYR